MPRGLGGSSPACRCDVRNRAELMLKGSEECVRCCLALCTVGPHWQQKLSEDCEDCEDCFVLLTM
jgi:hypothetical protein